MKGVKVCPVCVGKQPQGQLCHACTTKLETDLREMTWLHSELNTSLMRLDRHGSRSFGGKTTEQPLPFSVEASDALRSLRAGVAHVVRDIMAAQYAPCARHWRIQLFLDYAQFSELPAFLIDNIRYFRRLESGIVAFDYHMLRNAANHAMRVIDARPVRLDDVEREVDPAEVEQRLLTMREILDVLPGTHQLVISPKRFGMWVTRERLIERGRRGNAATFLVADVVELARPRVQQKRRA